LYFLREYEAAVGAAQRAIRVSPDFPEPYRWLAAALGQLDRTAKATEVLEKAIAVSPGAFDMYVRKGVPWMRPEDQAHMLEGLRKAGWGADSATINRSRRGAGAEGAHGLRVVRRQSSRPPRLARAKMQACRCAGQANRPGEHAIPAIAKASVKQVPLLSQWTTYHGPVKCDSGPRKA